MNTRFHSKTLILSMLALLLFFLIEPIASAATPTAPTGLPSPTPPPRTIITATVTSKLGTKTPTINLTPSVSITKTATTPTTPTPRPIPPVRFFPQSPLLTTLSAIAVDADTGQILFAKDAYERRPNASTTKIITALTLLSIPGLDLNDYTIVQPDDLVGEANMGLWAGERLKIIDLLYGLLLDSANDAAMTLARYGGSKLYGSNDPVARFVTQMNQEATSLGMSRTHFQNPHGLDEVGHYSSAEDLAIAGWYLLHTPTLAAIVKQSTASIDGFEFYNISNFIRRYVGATGVKPGQTDAANLCLVASATRYGHNAIVVLLNSPDMATESDLLMDYAFSQMVLNQNNLLNLGFIGQPSYNKLLPPKYNPVPTETIADATRWLTTVLEIAFSSLSSLTN